MKKIAVLVGFVLSGSAGPVQASVVTSLSGGVPVTMPVYTDPNDYYFAGPATFGPITYYSTNSGNIMDDPSVFGFVGNYGYGANGTDPGLGHPLAGLNSSVGVMTFTFSSPVRGVLASINWAIDPDHEWDPMSASDGKSIRAEIYDGSENILETLTFSNEGLTNVVQPGNWGFLRTDAEIASLRLINGYITARNFELLQFNSAIPEPSSWALMFVGFGVVGAVMRRRSIKVGASINPVI